MTYIQPFGRKVPEISDEDVGKIKTFKDRMTVIIFEIDLAEKQQVDAYFSVIPDASNQKKAKKALKADKFFSIISNPNSPDAAPAAYWGAINNWPAVTDQIFKFAGELEVE